ncbi:MAG: hypothetical protein ACRD0U_09355 [Acidimicrobiales bacterium]
MSTTPIAPRASISSPRSSWQWPEELDIPGELPALADEPATSLPFFEAYFSNFIEGTDFSVDEAEAIVASGEIPDSRERRSSSSSRRCIPMDDGNGRMARAAMCAELSVVDQARIVIPIVFRNGYQTALRSARLRRMDRGPDRGEAAHQPDPRADRPLAGAGLAGRDADDTAPARVLYASCGASPEPGRRT